MVDASLGADIPADVVVVGAGPAGATTAFFLAQVGVSVCLVDQATFPRPKPCGDSLGYHAVRMLQMMGLGTWLRDGNGNPCDRFLLSAPDGSEAAAPMPADVKGFSYSVPREDLDAALVDLAVSVGAHVYPGVQAIGLVRESESEVRLVGERSGEVVHYTAPLIVAADGGQATFTRQLGLAPHAPEFVAVRAYYAGDRGDPHSFEIHWEEAVLPGYGWLFPTGDGTINVGLGASTRDVVKERLDLPAMLEAFVADNPHARERLAGAERVSPIAGHPLRTSASEITPLTDNILVVGEAAGLANPLSGEGIANSLVSAEMAAATAQEALAQGLFSVVDLASYGRAFHAHFDPLHRAARGVRSLLSRPWILSRAIRVAGRNPAYAETLGSVLVGKTTPAALLQPRRAANLVMGR